MSNATGELVANTQKSSLSDLNRIIGRYGGKSPGPLVIAVAGMHGNEPSGVIGMQELFASLEENQIPIQGEIVGVSGNLTALKRGERFLSQDLNRMWKYDQGTLLLNPGPESLETPEFCAINKTLSEILQNASSEVIFIDLHTTSSQSPPFLLIGDTLRNRNFVTDFPVPVILGLEENLNGPLLSYINEIGHISMGFEAGQHDAPEASRNQNNMLWMILEKAGCIARTDIPDYEKMHRNLSVQTKGLDHFFEVRYRHGITEEMQFEMLPGFHNFQAIQQDEHLANDINGKIVARQNGRIFMPLYQKKGDDGYFTIRQISGFWLGVSKVLRKLGLHTIMHALPGVRKHPTLLNAFILNTRTVRWGLQIFHLLGYRKMKREGNQMLMIRRPFDRKPPKHPNNPGFQLEDPSICQPEKA